MSSIRDRIRDHELRSIALLWIQIMDGPDYDIVNNTKKLTEFWNGLKEAYKEDFLEGEEFQEIIFQIRSGNYDFEYATKKLRKFINKHYESK